MTTRRLGLLLSFAAACSSRPPEVGDSGAPLVCDAPTVACGNACANPQTDDANCGRCGAACPADQSCAGGSCYPRSCGALTCRHARLRRHGCVERACFESPAPPASAAPAEPATRRLQRPLVRHRPGLRRRSVRERRVRGRALPARHALPASVCAADTCSDGIKNGIETISTAEASARPAPTGARARSAATAARRHARPARARRRRAATRFATATRATSTARARAPRAARAHAARSRRLPEPRVHRGPLRRRDLHRSRGERHRDRTSTAGRDVPAVRDGQRVQHGLRLRVDDLHAGAMRVGAVRERHERRHETDSTAVARARRAQTAHVPRSVGLPLERVHDRHVPYATCTDQVKNAARATPTAERRARLRARQRSAASPTTARATCARTRFCQAPTCGDAVQNGGESDVDCGGATSCPRCGAMRTCTTARLHLGHLHDAECTAPPLSARPVSTRRRAAPRKRRSRTSTATASSTWRSRTRRKGASACSTGRMGAFTTAYNVGVTNAGGWDARSHRGVRLHRRWLADLVVSQSVFATNAQCRIAVIPARARGHLRAAGVRPGAR